ncbi:MAG: hypothetical protein HQ593_04470 [Candidatus Omnitrophica bacterium]|nr:hypothetical protein [Candidatus Omnitrophota bacterium]
MKRSAKYPTSIVLLSLLLMAGSGCGRVSEDQRKEVLENDPTFRIVIEEMEKNDSEIADKKARLKGLKDEHRAKVAELRAHFTSERKRINADIIELRRRLEPDRNKIRFKLVQMKSELRIKRSNMRSLQKMQSDVSKLLKRNEKLNLSGSEVADWKERYDSLNVQVEFLKGELAELEYVVRLLGLKSRIIKQ